jgi:hypothetical protein
MAAEGRGVNALMPLEERYERALAALGDKLSDAAQARGDAERLEARLKQRKAILTLKHRKEAGSAAMAETMALADREYELALAEYETARIKYLLADAEAEKAKLSFEAWRTASSNRRAEMNLR